MASLASFIERRSASRLRETPLRRRNLQGRPEAHQRSRLALTPRLTERRRRHNPGFDVAATLELNLNRYPTKPAMLTFLHGLLYAAETAQLSVRQPEYVNAMRQAADFVEQSAGVVEGVATIRGYQEFLAARETRQH